MNLSNVFEILIASLTGLALFVYSFFALFRTRLLMGYYFRTAERSYIRSLKKGFFSNRISQYLAKRNYERQKNVIDSRMYFYNFKVFGIVGISIAMFMLLAIIHDIFKISFGLFIN